MSLTVDIQCASIEPVPAEEQLRSWINAALNAGPSAEHNEVSVRLVDTEEMRTLNANFRDKEGSTNVLSFPTCLPEEVDTPLLGDIVVCVPVVRAEAQQQGKSLNAHWAHMMVHGTLHLLGYDHIKESEAKDMEALETAIMQHLNYDCPYQDSDATT
jgi:probable rRNA maturation factor